MNAKALGNSKGCTGENPERVRIVESARRKLLIKSANILKANILKETINRPGNINQQHFLRKSGLIEVLIFKLENRNSTRDEEYELTR
jgi:hypothetical protein